MAKILVIDDERSMRDVLRVLLEGEGHEVLTSASLADALRRCERDQPDLIFSDLRLPDGSGMAILDWVRHHRPETQVVMMTAFATTENAVEAMRLGAYDYQIKPFKVDEVRVVTQKALEKASLLRENRSLRAQLSSDDRGKTIVGRSRAMAEVLALIDKVADTPSTVLIEGESGTGKELVARAIHWRGERRKGPFVAVNCAAIPESLIESELFGHAAGAFTGAHRARAGLFETAHRGTLLLDEVGELPLSTQAKLLRVLQEKAVRRVGEGRERPVDVRILAATNRSLEQAVAEGRFREDLYYRLHVFRIVVPPLRERREDIPLLARAFLLKHAEVLGKRIEGFTDEALEALERHDYKGNVRELENYVERAVTLASGPRIGLEQLPSTLRRRGVAGATVKPVTCRGGIDLEAYLEKVERELILDALEVAGGVKTKAAQLLGISFRSLRYRLKKLGLEAPHESAKLSKVD